MSLFLNINKQKKKTQYVDDYLSPYNQQANKFMKKSVDKHNKSRHHN